VGPNDALYTDSTLALDADTGKLAWHFQHVRRDVWDLDWVFEQSLVDLTLDGKPRKLVVTGGKIALFDAVDRTTGQYVFSRDVGVQNLVTAIDPKTGVKTTNPAVEPEAGKAKLLCPGSGGARNWPTTAVDPTSRILYVPLVESCADYTYAPRSDAETAKGGIDMRFSSRLRPDSDGKFGRVQAIDLATGKVVWTDRRRAPVASSLLVTGGGLLFEGFLDRSFEAYDAATGKTLWRTRLNASPSASPITYSVGGKQYVAVVTGGGGAFDAGGRGLAPEIDSPAGGTTLVVFALP
jgi:alcohol dehydrogenase (cytochrome c)